MSGFMQLMMRNKDSGGAILYQPDLNGSEQITTLQGQTTPTISNNTLTGGNGYLTQGWDNTVLWQLTFKAYGSGSGNTVGVIICPPTTTQRDYSEFMLVQDGVVYMYTNGSSSGPQTALQNKATFKREWSDTITITKTSSTNINIKYKTYEANYTYNILSSYSRVCIGIDRWSSYYASIKEILVIQV